MTDNVTDEMEQVGWQCPRNGDLLPMQLGPECHNPETTKDGPPRDHEPVYVQKVSP